MATGTVEKNKDTKLPAKPGTQVPAQASPNTPATLTKSIVDRVSDSVNKFVQNGQLHLPSNYSVDNALKSAYLILQTVEAKVGNDYKPALEVCTRESIANALLDMVVQGLNPGKKQCYFIAYAKILSCQRSYFGSMAVAEMVQPKIKDWGFNVVYEGDTFKYEINNGKNTAVEHMQDITNVDKANIKAAYAMALDKDGNPIRCEIMTIDEIHQAWRQSKMRPIDDQGNLKADSTHGKFTKDMALKTVINKVAKFIINASSDNTLLLERINRNENLADEATAQAEIDEHANKGGLVEIPAETAGDPEPEAAATEQAPAGQTVPSAPTDGKPGELPLTGASKRRPEF